ncbi:MAG: hypothetical protein NZ480_04165 [Bdellovibrionaceae bacterium]|nr:hypothetical protein [Pseudobdellovibrionaceae bacterium]MDW8189954.1 hypothetical protein [Pseudobdellovibrionaceae bacterium]
MNCCYFSFWFLLLLLHTITPHHLQAQKVDQTVLVRQKNASVTAYYKNLYLQPSYLSPIQAYQKMLESNDTTPEMIQKIIQFGNNRNQISDTQKEQFFISIYETKPSHNFYLLAQEAQKNHQLMEHTWQEQEIQSIESQLRRLRTFAGGEDLVLFINGIPWEQVAKDEKREQYQNWTIISSAWAPCSKVGSIPDLIHWISSLNGCAPWIMGDRNHYSWSQFSFLKNFKRSIFWADEHYSVDNWFSPQSELNPNLSDEHVSNKKVPSWIWWGAAVLISAVALHLTDHYLVIEY